METSVAQQALPTCSYKVQTVPYIFFPALPSKWQEGHVSGLRCIGGFIVEDLTWEHGKLKHAVLRSTLGGNLRLRSYTKLKTQNKTLQLAHGNNPNTFFSVWTMPVCRVSAQGYVHADESKDPTPIFSVYLYDVTTHPGELIHIEGL